MKHKSFILLKELILTNLSSNDNRFLKIEIKYAIDIFCELNNVDMNELIEILTYIGKTANENYGVPATVEKILYWEVMLNNVYNTISNSCSTSGQKQITN